MALKVEAKGAKGGNQWDDGSDYEGVTKIHVRGGHEGIQFIMFEYVKAGKTIVGPIHGVSGRRGLTQMFEIDHSTKEYMLSVEGYYDESTGVIQSVQFKTSTKTSELMGYDEGTKFSLGVSGKKIIGFHGFAVNNLTSVGAYFIRSPSIKSAIQGGTTSGKGFDDGGDDYDGIRKVYVTFDGTAIRHIKIDYDKAGQVETRERGDKMGTVYEFEVNHPYEYLTSVEVTYDVTRPYRCDVLRSFIFKTSKGRTSPVIGKEADKKFVLESKGSDIVGFHGRVGLCIDGIGAYYAIPLFTSPPKKLQGQGSDGGNAWDDGAFLNVKKIYVGQGDVGIVGVKFEYENESSEVIVGEEHGKPTLLGYEEFELDYPSEYISSVEGCHDKVLGAETGVITMLRIKTNKRTSTPFGLESGSSFILKKDGHKIIGFHGKADTLVHQIGVHVVPISQ